MNARLEMVPGDYDAALGRELAPHHCYHLGFHVALACRADDPIGPVPAVEIERVTSAAAMEEFLSAYVAGWGFPQDQHPHSS